MLSAIAAGMRLFFLRYIPPSTTMLFMPYFTWVNDFGNALEGALYH